MTSMWWQKRFPSGTFFSFLSDNEYTICLLSLVINLFHLIVLTRKYMRTSSIYILLIAICVSELYSSLITLKLKFEQVIESSTTCSFPSSLVHIYFDRITLSLSDNTLRLTTWLTVTLALIRVLVLQSKPDNRFQMLSAPGFGWLLTFFLFAASFVMSLTHYYRNQIQEIGPWVPKSGCDPITVSPPLTQYSLTISDLYVFGNGIFAELFFVTDGFFTHLVPCLLLLILIVLLSIEIRKSVKIRRNNDIDRQQNPHQLRNEQTTKLVNVLSIIAFLIESAHSGMFITEIVIGRNTESLKHAKGAMNWAFALNSASRIFLCAIFSCRYRNTVRRMFGFRDRMSIASHKPSFAPIEMATRGRSLSSIVPPSSPKLTV